MSEQRCKAMSHRLNCSCCDSVYLSCDLPPGHTDPHAFDDHENHLRVTWSYLPGWGRGRSDTRPERVTE